MRARRRRWWPLPLTLALLAAVPLSGQLLEAPAADEPASEGPLEAEAAPRLAGDQGDRDLEERLEAIYGNLSGLRQTAVEVGAGVVRLRGVAATAEAREQAAEIARRQQGVLAVDNRIEVERGLARRLRPVRERLIDRVYDLLAFLPLLAVALAVLALFWALSRLIGRLDAPFRPVSRNRFVRELARRVVQGAVLLLGIVLVLEVVEATALVGAVLGAAGLIGLALGFAFRDMAENAIASVLLALRQPFAPGDHVVIEEAEGRVVRLTSRATILMTLDGNHLRIPNAAVFKGTILNYTRNPLRRLEFRVGVGLTEPLLETQELAAKTLLATEGVTADPPPVVLVDELGDDSVVLLCWAWMDQRGADFYKVRSEARRRVKEALEREGIDMPLPTSRVILQRDTGRPEAPPRQRPGAPVEAAGDVSRERHLDDSIAAERAAGEDLLESDGAVE